MSILQANCPSCAAPLEFKSGSTIVLVCPFCRSAVARTDRSVEDLGKVAEIAESESPLKIGLTGEFRSNRFELTGRAQMKHEAGGVWDEWYATFSNGSTGWLAEAQGKFYLTFNKPLPENVSLPDFETLAPGQAVSDISDKNSFVVAEKGTATHAAADGEIPYKLTPNERSDYADLSGANRAFATIDYGADVPVLYVGEEVSLEDLGLANAESAERKTRTVSAARLNCPNCAGPLELRAPDKAERVTCPNCDSLLDVNQGNLSYLHALNKELLAVPFVLNAGQTGIFAGGKDLTVIGAVSRSVSVDGETYFWHEYLLYNPRVGFRWLTHSDNHWNFVEPVNIAEVESSNHTVEVIDSSNTVRYKNETFKVFQDAPARVEYVKGEFYWRVETGETVRAVDYVKAPLMLSQEISKNEINWSLGTYLTVAEVEKAFSINDLPLPRSVAPNQPFTGGFYINYGLLMLGLLCVIALLMVPLGGLSTTVFSQKLDLPTAANGAAPQTIFSQPFELKGNRNVKISAEAYFINSYIDIDVDLINDQNNEIESINIPINYYRGEEGGESWTEGAPTSDATISSLPAGKYTLRFEGTTDNSAGVLPVAVKVEQNVARGVNFWLSFILLSLLPIWAVARKLIFESRRWSESMFSSGSSSGDDGGE